MKNINTNYLNRDFSSLKNDLMNYIKVYYPNNYTDFSESTVGMMLLELNAYVGDILSYHCDKSFNELWLDTAKNRKSVTQIAKNLGYKLPGKKSSVTLLDISIEVPTSGDTYNEDYLITLENGFSVRSINGTVFEVNERVNFSSHYNVSGMINRTIEPVYNKNGEIIKYKITKRVGAVAGEIKTTLIEITSENFKPFFNWKIDENDDSITEILNVITKSDRFSPVRMSDWEKTSTNTVWYEVEHLAENKIFVETSSESGEGYWKYVQDRYTVNYDEDGIIYVTFGNGVDDDNLYSNYLEIGEAALSALLLIKDNNLGNIPNIGSYLHCRYKTGGGINTNVPKGTITSIVSRDITSNPSINVSSVIESLKCTNPIPAIGGMDHLTTDEIKNIASNHYSAQERCVTANDYISRISLLPAKYGSIFRSYVGLNQQTNAINIFILTLDENGKLKNVGNDVIKSNLASYLSNYKMLSDLLIINNGKIINIAIDFKIQVEKSYNKKEVIFNCINEIKYFFNIKKWHMFDTIYISHLVELLRKQPGVINVVDLEFKNKVGGNYSNNILNSSKLTDLELLRINTSGEVLIIPIENKIQCPIDGMFEIKYFDKDLTGGAI